MFTVGHSQKQSLFNEKWFLCKCWKYNYYYRLLLNILRTCIIITFYYMDLHLNITMKLILKGN